MWMLVKSALLAAAVGTVSLPAHATGNAFTLDGETENISWSAPLGALETIRLNYDVQPNDTYMLDLTFTAKTRALLAGILNNVRFDIRSQDDTLTAPSRTLDVNLISKVATASIHDYPVKGPFSIVFANQSILGALVGRIDAVSVTGTAALVAVPEISAAGVVPAAVLVFGAIAMLTGARRRGGVGA